jgi:pilus assembly protein CpaB
MWKVKRMNTARIFVLTIALGGGGFAAFFADGPDNTPVPSKPVAGLRTAAVLGARADIGPGRPVTPERTPA